MIRETRIVGFNKGKAETTCGSNGPIAVPEECIGKTCLCLCHNSNKSSKECVSKETTKTGIDLYHRQCFAFEDVDYFIGEKEIGIDCGDSVSYPGIGKTNYLVLEGWCGPLFQRKITKDIKIEKITEEGMTFIKITEV